MSLLVQAGYAILKPVDKQLANQYMRGWHEVAKVENRELRTTSLRVKFTQMLSLFSLGIDLGIVRKRRQPEERDVYPIRARWVLLKEGC